MFGPSFYIYMAIQFLLIFCVTYISSKMAIRGELAKLDLEKLQ